MRAEERITGIPSAETLGRPLWEVQLRLVPEEKRTPDLGRIAAERIERAFEEGPGPKRLLEQEIQRPDGSRRFIQSVVFVIETDDRILACGIVRDLTERVELERDLAAEKRKFQSVVESTPDMIARLDKGLRYIYVSPSVLLGSGLRSDSILGKTISELGLPPDLGEKWQRAVETVFATGRQMHFEAGYNTPAGLRYFASSIVPEFSEGGQVETILVVARDITDRKRGEDELRESEDRFRKFFELGLVGMAIESPTGEWIEVNDRLCDIYGYSRDELVHLHWRDITYPDDLDKDLREFNMLVQGAIDHYVLEKRYIRKDGRIIYCTISVRGSRRNNHLAFIYVIVVDITAQKEAETELAQAKEHLEAKVAQRTRQLQLSKERLEAEVVERKRAEKDVRELAHRLIRIQEEERLNTAKELHDDIGQLLTYVRLQLDAIHRISQEPATRQIEEIQDTIAKTVQQVRNLSSSLRPAVLDGLGLLPALDWLIGQYTAKTGITVNFRRGEGIPTIPDTVSLVAFRVVQEALTNVAKHAHVQEVDVSARFHSGVLLLEISDKGAGFDPASATLSAGIAGMRERVRQAGGRFAVRSKPGAGTTVSAQLPVSI